MRCRVVVLALVVLGVALWAAAAPTRGDNSPPEVIARWWEPRYPIAPETVRIFAHVTDPDGVRGVEAVWCYVPAYLCLYPVLYDDGTNGDAVAGDGIWTNVSARTDTRVEGASYKLYVVDRLGNSEWLPAIYALFVDDIDLTVTTPFLAAEPEREFTIAGTAFYEGNETAPSEGVDVAITVDGKTTHGVVDAAGRFAIDAVAPANEGTYSVQVRATDRRLSAQGGAMLAVSRVPRPDLLIESPRITTPEPKAGQTVSVTFLVRNVGSAAASDARVLAEVATTKGSRAVLDLRTNITAIGGNVPLVATWKAEAGSQTLRITVDPGGEIDELNEANNVAELPVDARPPEGPGEGPSIALIGAGAATVGATAVSAFGLIIVRRRRARGPPDSSSEESKGN